MKMEEKIQLLRKQKGWSQEELAFKLEVSRQAVSKWESGTSIPDMDKILKMSEMFNVTTDFLLKEDDSDEIVSNEGATEQIKYISKEDAENYVTAVKKTSLLNSLAVALCILSPITLILLAGFANDKVVSDAFAVAIGITVLLVLVAIAVVIFVVIGTKLKNYEYLETEKIKISNDTKEMIRNEREKNSTKFIALNASGIALCILAVIPLIVSSVIEENELLIIVCVGILLFIAAVGVFLLTYGGNNMNAYNKLMQENDYSIEHKETTKKMGVLPEIYWGIVIAGYLLVSFLTLRWDMTWIIWPVAGVLFGAVYGIAYSITKNKK